MTPATTFVPYSMQRRVWNEPSRPVIPWTRRRGGEPTRIGLLWAPAYDLHVEDWLWHGYHDRQHAADIRRALQVDWQPQDLTFLPEIEAKFRAMTRYREGFLRAVYSLAEDAWDEAGPDPGWTYRDTLAHVASNGLRIQTRLRDLLGQHDEAELEALRDWDGWDLRAGEERRARWVLYMG